MISEVGRLGEILRRRWIAVALVLTAGLVAMPFAFPFLPIYKGQSGLLIVSQALKDTTLGDPDLPSVVTSTEVLSRVIHRLNLHTNPVALGKNIKTKLPPKSSILEITYRDVDGNRSAAVANAVADESVTFFHEIATRGYTDVLAALNKRLAESRGVIAEEDKRLQQASADNGFASSDKALDDLTSQINDLQAQRGQVASSLAADQASSAAVSGQLEKIAPIVRGEVLQKDVVYQQVQSGLGKDEADLVSEKASFKDSFPGLGALRSRVVRERAQAKITAQDAVANGAGESPSYTQTVLDGERASALVSADQERLRATDDELQHEQTHLRQVAGAGATVGTLRAERDASLQQYIGLTQRLGTAQADAAQASSIGSLVVVSRAVPGTSDLPLFVLAMVAIVFLLAIIIGYLIDAADRRFWTSSDMERVYGRPVFVHVGGR